MLVSLYQAFRCPDPVLAPSQWLNRHCFFLPQPLRICLTERLFFFFKTTDLLFVFFLSRAQCLLSQTKSAMNSALESGRSIPKLCRKRFSVCVSVCMSVCVCGCSRRHCFQSRPWGGLDRDRHRGGPHKHRNVASLLHPSTCFACVFVAATAGTFVACECVSACVCV